MQTEVSIAGSLQSRTNWVDEMLPEKMLVNMIDCSIPCRDFLFPLITILTWY